MGGMQLLTTAPLLLSPQVGRIGAPRMGGMQVLTTAPSRLSSQVGRIRGEEVPRQSLGREAGIARYAARPDCMLIASLIIGSEVRVRFVTVQLVRHCALVRHWPVIAPLIRYAARPGGAIRHRALV